MSNKSLSCRLWFILLSVTIVYLVSASDILFAQTSIKTNASLYEQASEVSGLIIQYGQDVNAIRDFYSPYTKINGYEDQSVQTSPEERKRLIEIGNDYLEKLKQADFDSMSIYGKVDYILLKKEIVYDLGALKLDEDEYNRISAYIPFADDIYQLEKKRRRGISVEGQEVGEGPASPHRFAGTKTVAEEVELVVLVVLIALAVPAVHDPCLVGMRLQLALLQSPFHRRLDLLRLLVAWTMDHHIVRIALELDTRVPPSHPDVERVVQKQVGQQRTEDSALRRTLRSRLHGSIRPLHGGS